MLELQTYFASRFMMPFHAGIIGTSESVESFRNRDFIDSYMWCKSKVVEDTEGVLAQWREQRNNDTIALPVCLMGVKREIYPTDRSRARPVSTPKSVQLEVGGDHVEYQSLYMDRSVQVVFIGATESATRSLSQQFCLHASRPENRSFQADYDAGNGEMIPFPCSLDDNNLSPDVVETDQSNISIHKVDLMIHETIPYFGKTVGVVKEVDRDADTIASSD